MHFQVVLLIYGGINSELYLSTTKLRLEFYTDAQRHYVCRRAVNTITFALVYRFIRGLALIGGLKRYSII